MGIGDPDPESFEAGRSGYWDGIYSGRPSDQLGWYESVPSTLGLVRGHSVPSDAVIDIGGGDGHLTAELLAAGHDDLTVLDLSEVALGRARSRLGPSASQVAWVTADVTAWVPPRTWDLWHDRAVFHFLVDEADREAYRRAARSALGDGGRLVVATFAPDGPDRCAGLPVRRYSCEELVVEFGSGFRVAHVGPLASSAVTGAGIGDQRPYVAAVFEVEGLVG